MQVIVVFVVPFRIVQERKQLHDCLVGLCLFGKLEPIVPDPLEMSDAVNSKPTQPELFPNFIYSNSLFEILDSRASAQNMCLALYLKRMIDRHLLEDDS
jgi:hypothetical protein